jgi:hypothetical protein
MGRLSRPALPIFPTTGIATREVALVPKSPEQEVEEFLASKPTWMEKALQGDFSLMPLGLEWTSNLDRVFELTPKYERILRQIPAKWKEYRKERKRNYGSLAQPMVPKGKPGRPSKSALAEEAANLRRSGMNNLQIAAELNKRPGEKKTTSEAIRKLLKRHPDKS